MKSAKKTSGKRGIHKLIKSGEDLVDYLELDYLRKEYGNYIGLHKFLSKHLEPISDCYVIYV